ncbi:MAG TPA: hypothetical protein VLV18_03805 [Terriglobales bacterium]|nr:hypothetical protein [Terriglobales bacterium]
MREDSSNLVVKTDTIHGEDTRQGLMIAEAQRLVKEGNNRNLHLRLLGAMAFQVRCPKYNYLTTKLGRILTDVDLAGYGRERGQIEKLMRALGYEDNKTFTALFGHMRMIWDKQPERLHVDIFLDKLEMNHQIPFANRLELESVTIPLADMLLEKMQIVQINEKDVVDTIMLLREHEVGDSDREAVDSSYIAEFLADDWGFYYTVTTNLAKVRELLGKYPELTDQDRADVTGKIDNLLRKIENQKKTTSWKLRARVGTKKKWYNEVEETSTMT